MGLTLSSVMSIMPGLQYQTVHFQMSEVYQVSDTSG